MEVFGAVVNVFSFIDLCSKVTVRLAGYVYNVKGAEGSRERFTDELVRNMQVLKALQSLRQQLEQQSSSESKERLKTLTQFFQDNTSQSLSFYQEFEAFAEWLEKDITDQTRMGLVQK